jgi:hypothetical protein
VAVIGQLERHIRYCVVINDIEGFLIHASVPPIMFLEVWNIGAYAMRKSSATLTFANLAGLLYCSLLIFR